MLRTWSSKSPGSRELLLPIGASRVNPAVWPSSMRSVIFRSGWASKALWTVNSGRYVVIGSSSATSPSCTARITAVAVNTFDIDCTLKIVSAVTGALSGPSTWPNPSTQRGVSPSTTATARPGTPCSAMSRGISARKRSITGVTGSAAARAGGIPTNAIGRASASVDAAAHRPRRSPARHATDAMEAVSAWRQRAPRAGRHQLPVDGIQPPLAGYALENMAAAIVERKARADDQVLHGARHEDLAGCRERGHPRPEVDSQPGNVVRQDLDLSDVDPGSDLEPQLPHARRGSRGRI